MAKKKSLPVIKAVISEGRYLATCPHCGDTKNIGVWAVAHLNEWLIGTCEVCGKQYILNGKQ